MNRFRNQIIDLKLVFREFPAHETGLSTFCRSFSINLSEVKLIAISPRLVQDDETLFILLIGFDGKKYPIPNNVLGTAGQKEFENHFQLKPIHKEWQKFDYDDHYGKYDKIIYPKEYYGENLFEKNWKLKIRGLFSWAIPKLFFGTIKKEYL